ncbi:MAG: 4-diphosphocytidyl-2-C-methyl-D-erythritol kinase, partial [Candidatus Anoxychlamydiales bacterium]|nr:4-diphosphocytidyl-2-C-methyl-D-erythritol kinase [Candidatus Anoxychlamydiales bacterium]
MSLTFYSPAKVNLFFKILSKKQDGYHDIFSLNQAISLFDVLYFKKAKKDIFFCYNNKDLKFDETNLIIKALNLFRDKTKIKDSVEIYLKKNIPIEAGLGGGSSNAATTLFALNELFQKPLTILELIELSKNIGADAPFFFSKGSCFCKNIGDIFEDFNLNENLRLNNLRLENLNFHIAKP